MRPVSNLGQLNTNDWERLQTHADRFEDACKAGQAVDLRAFLPPETDPLRRNCLHELIKLDLELRWRRGEAVTLSYYLEKFTELGPARSLPTSLLFEEFLVRHRHGDRPSLESYKARFPEQFEELARLVRERDMPTSAGPVATPFSRKARPAAPVPSPPPTPTGFPIAPGAGVLQAGSVLSTGHSLVKRIGMGGFGEVWEALAPGGVRTAIKIILRPLDHEAAKHELEALELIKNLRHHFLLRTHAFKAELDRLVIVMDLADGSLRDRLKQIAPKGGQGLPLEELLLYARETGEALDYLHSKGVMHRDIKPENLLMSEGHIRVADFGLALLHKGARSIAGSGSGTPLYMPPEFWREKVSINSDQYSFAASYVELRLGRRLFPDQGFMSLMKAHLDRTPELDPLSKAEQEVLLRALAKEPKERFPECKAFIDALERAVQAEVRGPQAAPEAGVDARRMSHRPPSREDTDPVTGTLYPGGGGSGSKRTDSKTVDLDKPVWRPELRPLRLWLLLPVLALVGLVVWLLAQPGGPDEVAIFGAGVAPISSPEPPLPAEGKAGKFRPVLVAGTRWVRGREYYKRIECEVRDGPRVVLLLIASDQKQLEPFYMMRDKVWNELFAVFAKIETRERPEPHWRLGGRVDLAVEMKDKERQVRKEPFDSGLQFGLISAGGPPLSLPRVAYGLAWRYETEKEPKRKRKDCVEYLPHPGDVGITDGKLPVFRVGIEDAHHFAAWFGGQLPSAEEWDVAAGGFELEKGKGPYQVPWAKGDIAINRKKEGPSPIDQANKDVSSFGCRHMAGNGKEWTRSYLYQVDQPGELRGADSIPMDALFRLRGCSYTDLEPLEFDYLKRLSETQPFQRGGSGWTRSYEIGFRVVVRP